MSDEKKSETIHIKRFQDGRMTPEEYYVANAWGGRRCDVCGGAARVRAISYAKPEDLNALAPEMLVALSAKHGGSIPMIEFTYGKFVRIADAFACSQCRPSLERQAARGPSWVLVAFQEPPKNPLQVQSAGGARGASGGGEAA